MSGLGPGLASTVDTRPLYSVFLKYNESILYELANPGWGVGPERRFQGGPQASAVKPRSARWVRLELQAATWVGT